MESKESNLCNSLKAALKVVKSFDRKVYKAQSSCILSSFEEETKAVELPATKRKVRLIELCNEKAVGYHITRKKVVNVPHLSNGKNEVEPNANVSSIPNIQIHELTVFPEYEASSEDKVHRKIVLNKLRKALKEGAEVKRRVMYNVILPEKAKKRKIQFTESITPLKSRKKKGEGGERDKSSKGRMQTLSIALPGSILGNAQSPQLRTYLAGQIARALVIFNVDEVIVFREGGIPDTQDAEFKGSTKATDPNVLLARILQYLECPQYLRKYLFQKHPDLQFAGLLNPLDCPHHMRTEDEVPYREGVVLDRPVKTGGGSYVHVGTRKEVCVDRHLKAGIRVTVQMEVGENDKRHSIGKIVPPSRPRTEDGIYWGYNVRMASSFGAVFTQCPYKEGYDLTIGTSERGNPLEQVTFDSFRHCLVVFGGLKGLEASLESDEGLSASDPSLLFDYYINSCCDQGSRTIRTEEAILITMSVLRTKLNATFATSS